MSSQWKIGSKKWRHQAPIIKHGIRLGPPTGTEHYQATQGMVRCTGTLRIMAWVTEGQRPRGSRHVGDVQVSRVFWDSKTRGTYVKPVPGGPWTYHG